MDFTVVLALASLVVSFLTLYLAHLRGPDINLAVPGKLYYCHGLKSGSIKPDISGNHWSHFVLESNLLIANTGLRPGVVFSFRVDPADSVIVDYGLDPEPETIYPVALLPGESLAMKLSVQIRPKPETWPVYLARERSVQLRAVYLVSTSFGRTKEKIVKLPIDLAPLKATIDSDLQSGHSHD